MDASNNGIKFDCVGNFGCVGTRKGWIDHFLKPGMPFLWEIPEIYQRLRFK